MKDFIVTHGKESPFAVDLSLEAANYGVRIERLVNGATCWGAPCVGVYMRYSKGCGVIQASPAVPLTMRRAYIAHALGHHVLHSEAVEKDDTESISPWANDPREKAATKFGMALLCPPGLVDYMWRIKGLSVSQVAHALMAPESWLMAQLPLDPSKQPYRQCA